MNNNYYEIGTVGTTPIYEPARAKRRALGKLYTEEELQEAIKKEREDCIRDGYKLSSYNISSDMCRGSELRAYSRGQDNFAAGIRRKSEE